MEVAGPEATKNQSYDRISSGRTTAFSFDAIAAAAAAMLAASQRKGQFLRADSAKAASDTRQNMPVIDSIRW